MDQLDTIQAKPEHLIGATTGFSFKAFKVMHAGMLKVSPAPDVCVCGSQAVAEDVYSACQILGLTIAVIVDNELSPKRYWLTTLNALSKMPGGGRN